jgi:hypothetical protein
LPEVALFVIMRGFMGSSKRSEESLHEPVNGEQAYRAACSVLKERGIDIDKSPTEFSLDEVESMALNVEEAMAYPALMAAGITLEEVRAAGFSPDEMESTQRYINEHEESILALARWGFSAADVSWLISGDRVELVLSLLNELRTRPRNWECTYRCLQIILPSKFGAPSGVQDKPSAALNNTLNFRVG